MLLGGIFVIKDGSINVIGAFIDNSVPYVVEKNEDGSKNILKAEPCYNCGSEDVELIENPMYEPSLYHIRCSKCGCCVPEEIQDYTHFHDDGLVAAIKTWNIYCSYQEIIKSQEYSSRENYWNDHGIEPEETYQVNISDMARLYPIKNYPYTNK